MNVRRAPISQCLGLGSLYPFVLRWFAGVPEADRAGMRVLDLPAGGGVLSVPLDAAGFDVTPCDLFPEYLSKRLGDEPANDASAYFRARAGVDLPGDLAGALFPAGAPPVRADLKAVPADMEAELPFEDGSFDVVVCVEGIEHVMDRHAVLDEFRRVLKPGGTLILTTPNLLSFRARAAYAFAGQRAFHSYIDEHTSVWGKSDDGTRTYHGHAFLVNYFQVRYSLHHTGFKIDRLLRSNWSGTSVALSGMYPLVAFATWASQRRAKKRFARYVREGRIGAGETPPYTEMMSHLLSGELLYNATLILAATKR